MTSLAAIFDWDGVVADSSELHVLSWQRLADELGRSLDGVHGLPLGSLGVKSQLVITDMLHWTSDASEADRIAIHKEEIFRRLCSEVGLRPQPGVRQFLRSLNEAGIPCAVGSSAPRLNIEAGMESLGIRECFNGIACGDDVTRGKPAPDIFLKAADLLRAEPASCVVFEDAPAGVQAALAGNMKVVGVLTTHPASDLAGAHHTIPNFEGVNANHFRSWCSSGK